MKRERIRKGSERWFVCVGVSFAVLIGGMGGIAAVCDDEADAVEMERTDRAAGAVESEALKARNGERCWSLGGTTSGAVSKSRWRLACSTFFELGRDVSEGARDHYVCGDVSEVLRRGLSSAVRRGADKADNGEVYKVESRMSFIEDAGSGTLTVRDGNDDVLVYRYGDQLKKGAPEMYTRSCYVHPFYSLDGEVLTDDFPLDHLHHRGVFWTWPVVKVRGETTQTWHPASLRQHFGRWLEREVEDGAAVLKVENDWKLGGKEIVAKEIVTFKVHPANGVGRAIDVEIALEAVGGPMELGGAPESNKGYGGLSLRGAPGFKGAALVTDKGPQEEDAVNTAFLWADVSTEEHGVAIFVAPDHPDRPLPWLIRNSYAGFLNPSWPGLAGAVLEPGKPVVLKYRLYIHRGNAVTGLVPEAYNYYLGVGPR